MAFSSFLCQIFDDFSNLCSNFGALHFEKKNHAHSNDKNLAKIMKGKLLSKFPSISSRMPQKPNAHVSCTFSVTIYTTYSTLLVYMISSMCSTYVMIEIWILWRHSLYRYIDDPPIVFYLTTSNSMFKTIYQMSI